MEKIIVILEKSTVTIRRLRASEMPDSPFSRKKAWVFHDIMIVTTDMDQLHTHPAVENERGSFLSTTGSGMLRDSCAQRGSGAHLETGTRLEPCAQRGTRALGAITDAGRRKGNIIHYRKKSRRIFGYKTQPSRNGLIDTIRQSCLEALLSMNDHLCQKVW
jgi:hypothetical protein